MPFHMPYFNLPYFFNRPFLGNNYSNTYKNSSIAPKENESSSNTHTSCLEEKKYSEKKNDSNSSTEYFFELVGIYLYFDDILLICLLIFLYGENVKDDGLFICLILLLLTS